MARNSSGGGSEPIWQRLDQVLISDVASTPSMTIEKRLAPPTPGDVAGRGSAIKPVAAGTGLKNSGYAGTPTSGISSPASSTSRGTRLGPKILPMNWNAIAPATTLHTIQATTIMH